MSLKPRTLGILVVGGAILAGLLYVTFRPEPIAVDLHEVTRGPLQVTVDADGQTRIRDIFEVAAPISGTALRSPVDVGDAVLAGETVVALVEPVPPSLLDSRTRMQAEASVGEAEAALNVAQTELRRSVEEQTYAQMQFDRVQVLVERGVSSITAMEDVTQQLAIADATVDAAEARINIAQSTLDRSRAALIGPDGANGAANGDCCIELMSPADGVVLSVANISERPVTAGTPLVSIGDPTELEIVADLLSSDAVRLAPGAVAMVERWGGPDTLMAELDRVEPSARTHISALGIEEQRVDAIFHLTTPQEARAGLGDGFSTFLRIVEWQADEVTQVPLSALFRRGDTWAVFIANGNTAQEVTVELGRRSDRFAEVLSGLEPGAMVVTHPNDDLVDGGLMIDRSAL